MMPKNVLGLVFSNSYDSALGGLTARRTMGSVPFGGRYRFIDFMLSNLVNSGVTKVGLIANSNYHSLMDHVGSGRPWDLSRKTDGLFILPPFDGASTYGENSNRIDVLNRTMDFIAASKQEYVLLSDSNFICNLDFERIFEFHDDKNADITIVYCEGVLPKLENKMVLTLNGESKVTAISVDPKTEEPVNYASNVLLIRKALLERLIGDAESYNFTSFEKDVIQKNVDHLNIYGYKCEDVHFTVDSLVSYYEANMALLNGDIRKSLFNSDRPVLTKVRNDMPVIYGIGSEAKNSLIADGCIIDGTVKNSIIFRGARIAKGAVVENSIIMQDAFVGENAKLNCVIMDKNTVITPNKTLSGDKTYPIFIGKQIVI